MGTKHHVPLCRDIKTQETWEEQATLIIRLVNVKENDHDLMVLFGFGLWSADVYDIPTGTKTRSDVVNLADCLGQG